MNAFSLMFEKEENIGKGTITLTLKKMFHCLSDKVIVSTIPKDESINMAVLSSKGPNNRIQITSRSIWDFGKQVEKIGKKALAIVQSSEYKDSKLPSGKSYEDYLLFVQEDMYKEFKNSAIDNEEEDDNSVVSSTDVVDASNDMPNTWFFPGYISFALRSPIIPEDKDGVHKAEPSFATDNAIKGRVMIVLQSEKKNRRKSVACSDAFTLEGPGFLNKDYLIFAASVAQQQSAAKMVNNNKYIDRELKYYYRDKVKHTEREAIYWRSLLSSDIMSNPQHMVYI